MSYVNFDANIENEIIALSNLKKNKNTDSDDEFNDEFIHLDEENEENEKKIEKLKNESLKLYYIIDEEKNKNYNQNLNNQN